MLSNHVRTYSPGPAGRFTFVAHYGLDMDDPIRPLTGPSLVGHSASAARLLDRTHHGPWSGWSASVLEGIDPRSMDRPVPCAPVVAGSLDSYLWGLLAPRSALFERVQQENEREPQNVQLALVRLAHGPRAAHLIRPSRPSPQPARRRERHLLPFRACVGGRRGRISSAAHLAGAQLDSWSRC